MASFVRSSSAVVNVKASQGCRSSQPRPHHSSAKKKIESSHKQVIKTVTKTITTHEKTHSWSGQKYGQRTCVSTAAAAAASSSAVVMNTRHGKTCVAAAASATAVAQSSSVMEKKASRHGPSVSQRKTGSSGKKIVVDSKHISISTVAKSEMKPKATSSSSRTTTTMIKSRQEKRIGAFPARIW